MRRRGGSGLGNHGDGRDPHELAAAQRYQQSGSTGGAGEYEDDSNQQFPLAFVPVADLAALQQCTNVRDRVDLVSSSSHLYLPLLSSALGAEDDDADSGNQDSASSKPTPRASARAQSRGRGASKDATSSVASSTASTPRGRVTRHQPHASTETQASAKARGGAASNRGRGVSPSRTQPNAHDDDDDDDDEEEEQDNDDEESRRRHRESETRRRGRLRDQFQSLCELVNCPKRTRAQILACAVTQLTESRARIERLERELARLNANGKDGEGLKLPSSAGAVSAVESLGLASEGLAKTIDSFTEGQDGSSGTKTFRSGRSDAKYASNLSSSDISAGTDSAATEAEDDDDFVSKSYGSYRNRMVPTTQPTFSRVIQPSPDEVIIPDARFGIGRFAGQFTHLQDAGHVRDMVPGERLVGLVPLSAYEQQQQFVLHQQTQPQHPYPIPAQLQSLQPMTQQYQASSAAAAPQTQPQSQSMAAAMQQQPQSTECCGGGGGDCHVESCMGTNKVSAPTLFDAYASATATTGSVSSTQPAGVSSCGGCTSAVCDPQCCTGGASDDVSRTSSSQPVVAIDTPDPTGPQGTQVVNAVVKALQVQLSPLVRDPMVSQFERPPCLAPNGPFNELPPCMHPSKNPFGVRACIVTGKPVCAPALLSIHHPLLANVAICLLSLDGTFVDCNKEFQNVFEADRSELVKTTIFERTHRDDLPRLVSMYKAMLKNEISVWESRRRSITSTGRIIATHFILTTIKVAGHPLFFVGFCLPKDASRMPNITMDAVEANAEGCVFYQKLGNQDLGGPGRQTDLDQGVEVGMMNEALLTSDAPTSMTRNEESASSRSQSSHAQPSSASISSVNDDGELRLVKYHHNHPGGHPPALNTTSQHQPSAGLPMGAYASNGAMSQGALAIGTTNLLGGPGPDSASIYSINSDGKDERCGVLSPLSTWRGLGSNAADPLGYLSGMGVPSASPSATAAAAAFLGSSLDGSSLLADGDLIGESSAKVGGSTLLKDLGYVAFPQPKQ